MIQKSVSCLFYFAHKIIFEIVAFHINCKHITNVYVFHIKYSNVHENLQRLEQNFFKKLPELQTAYEKSPILKHTHMYTLIL